MAQIVGGAIGATVGFFVGGPAGAQYGWMIGAAVGGLAQKGPRTEGPRLGDLRVNGTEYGQTIPWVAGSPVISGQIAWASKRRETATTTSQGKGGGPEFTEYSYDVDLLILLTENESGGVARVWSNGEVVYGNGATKSGLWADLRVYRGTADQMPDPTFEAAVGAGNAPAYRGRTYVVIEGLQLGSSGYIPNLTFEIGQAAEGSFSDTYFYVDTSDGSFADDSCNSQIDTTEFVNGTTHTIDADGPLVVFQNGKPSDLIASGLAYRFADAPFLGASSSIVFDVVMSAFTPVGSDYVARADVLRFSDSAEDVASLGIFAVACDFDVTTGLVSGVRLSRDGVGSIIYTFPAPTGDAFRITVVLTSAGVAKLYVNEVLIGSGTYPGGASLATVLFLGGLTTDSTIFLTKGAYVSYFDVRLVIDPASDITTLEPPSCGTAVYGTAQPQPLVDVTRSLLVRAGYASTDFSVGALALIEKPVRGFFIAQISSTRAAIDSYQSAFFFEWSKSDRIYARPRALDPVVTIPFEDLGATESRDDGAEPFALKIANELEKPAQVSLSFNNVLAEYQVGTEHSDRIVSSQESTQAIQMPLGMTPTEGKGVADGLLFDMIAGIMTTTLRVGLKYAKLEPGDVILATNSDGRQYRLFVGLKRDLMLTIELECRIDDVGALTSGGVTDVGYINNEDPAVIAPTIWRSLDIPLLRDADNDPGYYVAVAPNRAAATNQWRGAVVARSWDGVAYERLYTTTDACVMGVCDTTLGDWAGGNYFDESSTLRVSVSGELASSTRDAMYADLDINMMLVGSELVRPRLCTLVDSVDGENVYELSSFLRGQRGTEWAMTGHAADERVVLLDPRMRRVTTQTSQLNLLRQMKAVTFNGSLSDVTAEDFTDTGVALRPFSVANPVATINGANIDTSWQRRSRLSYRYGGVGGVVVPLGEATEAYRIKVYAGATLVNTYEVTTPAWTYTAASIAADGFITGDPITFVVCQLSELVGEGYPETFEGIAP